MTYADTRSVTSLQGSADGPWLYVLPDGRTTDEFGLAHALASLSARQVAAMGLKISGISGRPGSISSKSADLTQCLGSRLQQRLASAGSILFRQTWKAKATASGLRFWAHTASAPLTSGSGCGSWPTPNAGPQNDTDTKWQARREACAKQHGNNGFGLTLGMAAQLASWPTPTAALADKGVRSMEGGIREAMRSRGADLAAMVCLASWVTPSARDWKDSPGMATTATNPDGSERSRMDQLPRQASGALATGCPAETVKPGQLNPAHSRWLMGYPAAWCACAPTATPSRPRLPRK